MMMETRHIQPRLSASWRFCHGSSKFASWCCQPWTWWLGGLSLDEVHSMRCNDWRGYLMRRYTGYEKIWEAHWAHYSALTHCAAAGSFWQICILGNAAIKLSWSSHLSGSAPRYSKALTNWRIESDRKHGNITAAHHASFLWGIGETMTSCSLMFFEAWNVYEKMGG